MTLVRLEDNGLGRALANEVDDVARHGGLGTVTLGEVEGNHVTVLETGETGSGEASGLALVGGKVKVLVASHDFLLSWLFCLLV